MGTKHSSGKPIVKAASACVWRGDEVLLIQRGGTLGKGRWSLPGGKVEAHEKPQAAAHRELFEEASVIAELAHHVGLFEIEAGGVHYGIDCFCGPWLSGDAKAGSDAADVAWVHYSRIAEREVVPNIVEAVARARALLGV
jgi:8-oxo-dGTP diphosphatase